MLGSAAANAQVMVLLLLHSPPDGGMYTASRRTRRSLASRVRAPSLSASRSHNMTLVTQARQLPLGSHLGQIILDMRPPPRSYLSALDALAYGESIALPQKNLSIILPV